MIPRIIHQLWSTNRIPEPFSYWQKSWRTMNPDFEYRLWTNSDIQSLIDNEAPQWSELFYSYTQNICRVDLARYIILQRHGGLYVDMDFECLRPHHRLLADSSCILAFEPESHSRLAKCQEAGLNSIVCNAWMASIPNHPFWDHLLNSLALSRRQDDVLELTGPFVLTRSISAYKGIPIKVLEAHYVYPVDKESCWNGSIQDLEYFELSTRKAFALHHWNGSWFRETPNISDLPVPDSITAGKQKTISCINNLASLADKNPLSSELLISCLMVTRGDPHRIRQAIDSFLKQTHPRKELVIVTDIESRHFSLLRSEYTQDNIRWSFIEDSQSLTLGDLRNHSLELAEGDYVAQWDDDDIYDPCRLQIQLAALLNSKAHAVFLERWTVWWPARRLLFIAPRRIWEGSMLCERRLMPRYPSLKKGEDTAVVQDILASCRVQLIDVPRIYIYVVHSQNTFDYDHFNRIYRAASVDFSIHSYARMMRELSRRVNIDKYFSSTTHTISSSSTSHKVPSSPRRESILILTPMRNTSKYVSRYFDLLERLSYPHELISIGIIEGDSIDGTFEELRDRAYGLDCDFASLEVQKHDTGKQWAKPRWDVSIQFQRRANLAYIRNMLISRFLRHHDWVLWIDADIIDYSIDLIQQMMKPRKDILAACCIKPDGSIFDQNTFIFSPGQRIAEDSKFLIDGIYQPPSGVGRHYLDTADVPLVPVDSVGCTTLLVRSNLYRMGLTFPGYSYKGYIESEGLSAMARDMGIQSWGARDIKVTHANQ